MKIGLVLEGGAMRGMFTAGVLDVMMENDITFPAAVGVSAGAAFGCNIKSHQIGRGIRYNKKYCNDPRYVSLLSLIRTGDIYNEQFAYHELPEKLDPFDTKTYTGDPMEFYVTCTDVTTGEPVYHRIDKGDTEDVQWIRASASMPLVSRIVELDGMKLLDGGIADSVPVRYMESLGFEKNVVVLTREPEYKKKKNSAMALIKMKYRKYPHFIKAVEQRHVMYNETLEYIKQQSEAENVFIIRPPVALGVKHIEKHPEELERVYQIGRQVMTDKLQALKEFLSKVY